MLCEIKKNAGYADKGLKDLYLGIGIFKNCQIMEIYIKQVRILLFAPGLIEEVAKVADENKMLWIPGCMTPI